MVIDASIKIKNYKCFGQNEQGFEKIFPLNILIGKNNSGKSSLVDMIEHCFASKSKTINTNTNNTRCILKYSVNSQMKNFVASETARLTGSGEPKNWLTNIEAQLLQNLNEEYLEFTIMSGAGIELVTDPKCLGQYTEEFKKFITNFLFTHEFRRISAERDIVKERLERNVDLAENGKGTTNLIWRYLYVEGYDQKVIKKELLKCLNEITKPDIEFKDITIKEDNVEKRDFADGEIYFVDKNENIVALSKMGSGIKTIILVLINLIVIPDLEAKSLDRFIFAFEELENNLHPALQRRLFNFICQYAEKNKCYFFITTHSNVVIDLFINNPNAQIIHVETNGIHSFAKQVITNLEHRNILTDLDFRASDLLLSNGVVWVEGPSDSIYLEILLKLYEKFYEVKIPNYCIQALSTALWKYAGYKDFDWEKISKQELQNHIISLAKLNHNHLIILDSDINYENIQPSKWEEFKNGTGKNKARLINESMIFANHNEADLINNYGENNSGKLFFWVTDGTFENYLEYFLLNKGNQFLKYFAKHESSNYLEKKRTGENSSKSKVELAAEIAEFVISCDIQLYDLAPENSDLLSKIKKSVATIFYWNESK